MAYTDKELLRASQIAYYTVNKEVMAELDKNDINDYSLKSLYDNSDTFKNSIYYNISKAAGLGDEFDYKNGDFNYENMNTILNAITDESKKTSVMEMYEVVGEIVNGGEIASWKVVSFVDSNASTEGGGIGVMEDGAMQISSTPATDNDDADDAKKRTIYYVTDEIQQSQYIKMFKDASLDAFVLTHNIDQPFISQLEHKNDKIKFQRIDAELGEGVKEEIDAEAMKDDIDTLTATFRSALKNDKLDVKVEKLKDESVSSMITLSEDSRRMQDMMKMYNMYGMDPSMFGTSETLVLNANNKLVQYVLANKDSDNVPMICEQLYDLAMISHKQLAPEAMTKFIKRSNDILMLLTK